MTIEFLGAAREVTGSKFLITTDSGTRILLDCGLYQGKGQETDSMNRDLGFNPEDIDYLLLSHAHIDHSGLIPYLHKEGFRGRIFCTPATRDLCAIMLLDSGHIQESDTRVNNKKRARQGLPPLEPIYNQNDARRCLHHFFSIPYDNFFPLTPEVEVMFSDTGHILGSSAVNMVFHRKEGDIRITYTGDIGRLQDKILRPPQPFPQADYILTESTYGDRLHAPMQDAEKDLLNIVRHTCVEKKGKLIIPSFSVGRTQELVYALNRLEHAGLLPRIEVFVDSPLSVNATEVMRLHPECFNDEMLTFMEQDPDPFGFSRLTYIRAVEKSKALNFYKGPCIIISASGMVEAGRIKHHVANSIEDSRNTILIVGYCAPSTLGARLQTGLQEVSIFGEIHPVRAEISRLESFSAHGDYQEMISYLRCQDPEQLKGLFLVHGEEEAQRSYQKHLETAGFDRIQIPARGEYVTI